jgi:hypothetical protein
MNRILVVICLACFAGSALAQQPGRVMTVTRSVKTFSELENQLDDARHGHDGAALNKLLAANFEQRSGAAPSAPIPRAEWLALPPATAQISQMAVHEYGDVAVVSFADAEQHAFIVDVWTKTGGSYALSVRYTSATPATAAQTKPENPAK